MRIVVSTDSQEYADIAKAAGAEAPFLRPAEISQDHSVDEEFFVHALTWLKENEGYIPDILVQLRPTYPTRSVETINECLDIFISKMDTYDSLRTVVPVDKTPYKMYRLYPDRIEPLFRSLDSIHEPFNSCRQVLPTTVAHVAYIDILKASLPLEGTMSGKMIYPYFVNKESYFDIDTLEDWVNAENSFSN